MCYCGSCSLAILFLTGVQISFTEDSYHAHEPDSGGRPTALPVLVFKNSRITSRVELVVIPLTIQEARTTSLPLPPNIPDDDPRSPPFASKKHKFCVYSRYNNIYPDLNDFNNTNITVHCYL